MGAENLIRAPDQGLLRMIASTNMWEIAGDSVGNGQAGERCRSRPGELCRQPTQGLRQNWSLRVDKTAGQAALDRFPLQEDQVKVKASLGVGALEPAVVVTMTSTVPVGSTGDVAMIMWLDSTVTLAAGVVPNATVEPFVNLCPSTYTVVPPVTGPFFGNIVLTTGRVLPDPEPGATNVNASSDVGILGPTAVVTMTSTVPAGSAGDFARMTWFDSKVTLAAATLPKSTVAVLVKC